MLTPEQTETRTMRALQVHEWGSIDALQFTDVPRPTPMPTEVLIRVKAVGLNPVDLLTIEGQGYMSAVSLPHVPSWDISGVIEEVGYGTRFTVGDEVYGMPWFPRAAGATAEYVVAPARQVALKASTQTFEEAAAAPLAGLTAYQMLVDYAHVGRGSRVVVNAAGGGCGHLAVQIGKALGAEVIGIASTAKVDFVKGLGADRVIDYTTTVPGDVLTEVDAVIDFVGGDAGLDLFRVLRTGGTFVEAHGASMAGKLTDAAHHYGVDAKGYLVDPDYAGLDALREMFEDGTVKVAVSHAYSFDEARDAFQHLADQQSTYWISKSAHRRSAHATGKIVLSL